MERALIAFLGGSRAIFAWPGSAIGLWLTLLFLLLATIGSARALHGPTATDSEARVAPSAAHLFGTDHLRRDALGRVLHGTRSVMSLAGKGTILAVAAGLLVGMISGYRGGLVDEVLMRVFDSLLAIPEQLLAGTIGSSRQAVLSQEAGSGDGPTTAADPERTGIQQPILELEGATVIYWQGGILHDALRDVSLRVEAGQTYGLVGESGSGKSTIAIATMAHLPDNASVRGLVSFAGMQLNDLPAGELGRVRGSRLSLVRQGLLSSLNLAHRIGKQLVEARGRHGMRGALPPE